MLYTIHFLLYNHYPQPHYQSLGTDTLVDEVSTYEQGKVYRLRIIGSTDDIVTWPEFVVIRMINQTHQQATLTVVFVVLLSEYEQFVELFQNWELN